MFCRANIRNRDKRLLVRNSSFIPLGIIIFKHVFLAFSDMDNFLQRSLFPWLIILRIVGCCSYFPDRIKSRNCQSRALPICQMTWCYLVLIAASVAISQFLGAAPVGALDKIGPLLAFLSKFCSMVSVPLAALFLIKNLAGVVDRGIPECDLFVVKHFTRSDRIIICIMVAILTFVLGLQTFYQSILPTYQEFVLMTKPVHFTFGGLNEKTGRPILFVLSVLYNFALIGTYCSQLFIVVVCSSLAICFKRVDTELAESTYLQSQTEKLKGETAVMKAFADYTELSNLVTDLDNEISTVLIIYYCNDVLWLLSLIISLKSSTALSLVYIISVATSSLFYMILRTTVFVYLHEKVCFIFIKSVFTD